MRSGSDMIMSKPMAALPAAWILSTSSASNVRGHGHCPHGLKAGFVYADNDDRLQLGDAGLQRLIRDRSRAGRRFSSCSWIPDAQGDECREQEKARGSAKAEPLEQTEFPPCLTGEPLSPGEASTAEQSFCWHTSLNTT